MHICANVFFCLCVCVCVCVLGGVCVHVSICPYNRECLWAYMHLDLDTWSLQQNIVHASVCMCVSVCIYVFVSGYLEFTTEYCSCFCVHVCVCVCVCVCERERERERDNTTQH